MHVQNTFLGVLLTILAATSHAQEATGELNLGVQMKFAASAPRFEPNQISLTFTKEFREQLGARLAKDLSRPELTAEQLTPARVSFSYAGSDVTGMRHAHLYLHFSGTWVMQENPDEFSNDLNEKASAGVVEVFAEHLNGLLEHQWRAADDRRDAQRDNLARRQAELQHAIQTRWDERRVRSEELGFVEGGTESLQAEYQQAVKQLRDDKIHLIELQAQRAAIESRIDRLRAQVAEQQGEDPLLAALQAEVDRTKQALSLANMNNAALDAAKEVLAAQESLFKQVEELREGPGVVSAAEVDKARANVAEARLRVAQIHNEREAQRALQVEKLAQAKIAFLQHQRTSNTGRLATQINKLSDMLDELAIEIDAINGRSEALEEAKEQLRGAVSSLENSEQLLKRIDSEINRLELQKAQVDEALLEVESEEIQVARQKLEIVPVIP